MKFRNVELDECGHSAPATRKVNIKLHFRVLHSPHFNLESTFKTSLWNLSVSPLYFFIIRILNNGTASMLFPRSLTSSLRRQRIGIERYGLRWLPFELSWELRGGRDNKKIWGDSSQLRDYTPAFKGRSDEVLYEVLFESVEETPIAWVFYRLRRKTYGLIVYKFSTGTRKEDVYCSSSVGFSAWSLLFAFL